MISQFNKQELRAITINNLVGETLVKLYSITLKKISNLWGVPILQTDSSIIERKTLRLKLILIALSEADLGLLQHPRWSAL